MQLCYLLYLTVVGIDKLDQCDITNKSCYKSLQKENKVETSVLANYLLSNLKGGEMKNYFSVKYINIFIV